MCTSFAVYSREKAIYGMNFDANEIDLFIVSLIEFQIQHITLVVSHQRYNKHIYER